MNKIVENKLCTILWYVENLKMSYVDPDIVSSVLSDIGAEYEKIAKITIMQGKIHKYLGMNIEFSSPGNIIFYMVN